MNRIFVSVCGAAILGLSAISTGASAGSLANAGGFVKNSGETVQAPVETVAWRRICRPVPRWAYGHRVMVNKCERVWVGNRGGPRYYGGGPYYGRPHGPPPARYGGGYYRGGPGYY